jgi:hypothetical protein
MSDGTPRRGLKGALLALVIFFATAGAAFAAALTVSGGGLGTGSVATSCQTSTITPTWILTYDAATPGYRITGVTLNGLETGCLNRSVRVVVADAAGTQVASGTGTTPESGSTADVVFGTAFTMGSPWLLQTTVMIYA